MKKTPTDIKVPALQGVASRTKPVLTFAPPNSAQAPPNSSSETLSKEEWALIDAYRALSPVQRSAYGFQMGIDASMNIRRRVTESIDGGGVR